jgi:hypothetical protein
MNGTQISRSPAEELAALVVTQKTSGNLAKTAARMNFEYFQRNPDHTQEMWQTWASHVEENGLCRLMNGMSRVQKKVADVETPRLMEEMGKVRGSAADITVWLPEKFPGKAPMKGSKEKYDDPPEGTPKPYDRQVKTKNVLQNHPEVYDDNKGDGYHVIEQGVGLAPTGKLYQKPQAPPEHAQLKNTAGEVKIYAKLGGTTTLSLAETSSIDPSPDYIKNKLKKNKKEWGQALLSVGRHIRTTTDVMKTVTRITGKHDGVKSDLFATGGRVWIAFRDGTYAHFNQTGDKLVSCNLTIEWNEPIPGDRKVKGSGIPQIEGRVPVVHNMKSLNYDNCFGYDMIKAVGSPSTGEVTKARPYSRIVFEFAGGKVPVRVPKTLWEKGTVPLWQADLSELYAAGPDADTPCPTLHKMDGAVFHGAGGEQDMGKFYKTVDIDKAISKKIGATWRGEGTKIREYIASRDEAGSPVYTFWRMRDENNGGTKFKPNSMQNIIAAAMSPDIDEIISFLREVDLHSRCSKLMDNLEGEIIDGLTQKSWENVIEALESEDLAYGIGDLLREHLSEKHGDADLPLEGEDTDLFAKYFLSG